MKTTWGGEVRGWEGKLKKMAKSAHQN